MSENQFPSLITDKGYELINDALLRGVKLDLSFIALGDSGGNYYEPDYSQTELVNEKCRIPISEVDGTSVKALIPYDIGGFYIREVGIFDSENNLILIAKHPETYKPIEDEGSFKNIWLKIRLKGVNPNAIEIKIDPNIQTASIEYVNNLFNDHKHPDLMPIWLYDTNGNGYVDTCDYVDGGKFSGDSGDSTNPDIPSIPQLIMSTTIYDKNGNGIVDDAENIDAGEF